MERRIIVFSSPSTVTLPDRISSFVALEAFAYQALQKKELRENGKERQRSTSVEKNNKCSTLSRLISTIIIDAGIINYKSVT